MGEQSPSIFCGGLIETHGVLGYAKNVNDVERNVQGIEELTDTEKRWVIASVS